MLIITILVSFFLVYILSRDDYVLLRRNITLDEVFNIAFIVLFSSIVSARIFFIAFHWSRLYLNLLAFILIPYFPGLSFPGGVLGGMIVLFFISSRKKFPAGRLFDIFSLSSLLGYIEYIFSSFIYHTLVHKAAVITESLHLAGYSLLFIFCLIVYRTELWKDGFIGSILWIILCIDLSIEGIIRMKSLGYLFLIEQSIFLVILFISIGVLVGTSNLITSHMKH